MRAGGAAGALATLGFPQMAFARAATERRFVFIIQRGAADGLHIVAPTGDPAFAAFAATSPRILPSGAKLGSFFTLHPALAETAKMYAARQALFVHAVASPYRDRSHFDGQNVLETGGSAAYRLKDGWMNRLLGLFPPDEAKALALVVDRADGASRQPRGLVLRAVAAAEPDRRPAGAGRRALRERPAAARPVERGDGDADEGRRPDAGGGGQKGAAIGALAAKMLLGDGARIAMIETNGWDTHSGQRGRLNAQLRDLDQMLAALEDRAWRRMGEHAGRRRDRVRPHRASQRHRRHRPRPGLGRDAARRRRRRRQE